MARPQQKFKRTRRRIEIHYGPEKPSLIGYSGNLSKTGVMVRAVRVFAPGTVLKLELKLPGATFRLAGVVIWAREGPVQWLSSGRIGMGITFIEPPEGFLNALQEATSR
jgi:PilZ domain